MLMREGGGDHADSCGSGSTKPCLQVDIEEGGVNGLVVRSLTRGGTLARDGRIQPGDYLVNVNGENLRSVSQAAALAVLRRTQLVPQGGFSIEHQQGMIS